MFAEAMQSGGFNPYAGIPPPQMLGGGPEAGDASPDGATSVGNYAALLDQNPLQTMGAPSSFVRRNDGGGVDDPGSIELNPEFTKWATDNQMSLSGGWDKGSITSALTDRNGQTVARGSQSGDDTFWKAALAAAAFTGAGVYGAQAGAAGSPLGIEGASYAMPGAESGFSLANVGAAGAEGGLGTVGGGMTAGGGSIAGSAMGLGEAAGYAGGSGMLGSLGGAGTAGAAGASSWLPASWGIGNGTALNLGGNLLSGLMGSRASGKAADALQQGGRESNALQKYMFDQSRADLAPYREAGTGALAQIQALLKNPGSITQDPGYQFSMDEGTKALNNGAAARGMTYSGQQGKALQKFGSDYAGTKLNESYNRLAGVAGIGQQATNSGNALGATYGQSVGNTLQGMGNARGSAYMGGANAWSGAIGNALNAYQDNDMSNRYYRRGG